jgi:hypothetical protein
MIGTEQKRITAGPMGEQETERRGPLDADGSAVELGPSRSQLRRVAAIDGPQDIARRWPADFPLGRSEEDSPRCFPGSGHGMSGNRGAQGLPQSAIIE